MVMNPISMDMSHSRKRRGSQLNELVTWFPLELFSD